MLIIYSEGDQTGRKENLPAVGRFWRLEAMQEYSETESGAVEKDNNTLGRKTARTL